MNNKGLYTEYFKEAKKSFRDNYSVYDSNGLS